MRTASLTLVACGLAFACATEPTDAASTGDTDGTEAADGADGSADGTSDGGGDSGVAAPTWNADVRPIFQSKCLPCHTGSDSLSGLPLESFDLASQWAVPIGAAVSSGSMPPWLADGDCNTYVGDYSLTDEEKETILAWVEGDAPEGTTSAADGSPFEVVALERVDQRLVLPEPYTPNAATPDDYRCFVMEWPYDVDTWVTGFDIEPGDDRLVHHVIPFLMNPDDAGTYRALDAADDGPGYACYGGPGGDLESLYYAKWLGGWAPGTGAQVFPEGHGIRVRAGSVVVAQVHYNLAAASPAPDQSAVTVQVETEPQKGAITQPFTNPFWVGGFGMEIPPHSEGVEHSFDYPVPERDGEFTIHSLNMHAHTLARSAQMWVTHADGTETCLVDIPNYDFNWQRTYALQSGVDVAPGDTISLRCSWDNPTSELVQWGDGTGDEMCLGIAFITWE